MRMSATRITRGVWLLFALSSLLSSACNSDSNVRGRLELPEPATARRALEDALRSWQEDPHVERTTTTIRPIMFVEQQQPPGQRLLRFDILGESPGYEDEGYRRFLARLSLAEPSDSVLATYYVFGEDPIWVYRSEDFEMIMHMDKSMMPATPPVTDETATSQGDAGGVGASSLDFPRPPAGRNGP